MIYVFSRRLQKRTLAMTNLKIATLMTLALLTASCAKSGSGSSGSAPGATGNTNAGTPQAGKQVGEGSVACPFSVDPATYQIEIPETTKLLDKIPAGRYVLTEIHTHRSSLTTLETAVFSNGAKIILKDPGQLGTNDTTQALIKDIDTPLTSGNLSFPLSFESKKGVIDWGRFASYEPKIETKTKLEILPPSILDHDAKILNENTGRYSFNVFARKQLSGYQTVVKLNKADFGFIKGLVAIGADGVRFVISMPRGSASTELAEATYELVFKLESKAKAPDCGANASALKVLGSST
jgi:hypothetical protein